MGCHVGIEELQPYIHIHPMVSYALNKTLHTVDGKIYYMVRTACRLFNWLKVDMFLNPTNIKPTRSAIDKSLIYTPGGEVSAEFHGLTQMNPYFILLNLGSPMNFYWVKSRDVFRFDYVFTSLHIHLTNVLSLRTGLLQTIPTLFQMHNASTYQPTIAPKKYSTKTTTRKNQPTKTKQYYAPKL